MYIYMYECDKMQTFTLGVSLMLENQWHVHSL
jgi:hypothetical protein